MPEIVIPFLDLAAQTRRNEPALRAAMDRVLDRAWYVLGEEGRAFESAFAHYLGVAHVVGVGSGTEALHLALTAAGVQHGDEVITVANTCVPTAAAIAATGARIRLADIVPDTMLMDPVSLESTITPKTCAIVPVHLYGHPCDMDAIQAIAQRHGITIVEDCAQAHGARYKNTACGGFGIANGFSFYPTKNLGALGDAGAIATNDDAIAQRLRMLRNYGEEKRYYHTEKGVNSRLDELQAAILREKLNCLNAWNETRRYQACQYNALLEDLPVTLPQEQPDCVSCWHLYPIRTPERDRLQTHLRDHGIGTLIHYPVPLHLQPGYSDLGYRFGDFPHAEKACGEVLSLPLYPELPETAIERIAQAIHRFFA